MRFVGAVRVRRRPVFYGMAVLALLGLLGGLAGFEMMDENELALAEVQTNQAPAGKVSIVINVGARTLEVFNDGQFHKRFRIAVGKSGTPTPVGEWNVVWKDYNWGTGFGTRWMGLNVPWGIYGIHGTNKPWSIGQFASHGCIRLRNRDIEELFEWTPVGTPVRIEGRKVTVSRELKLRMSGSDVVVVQMKLRDLGLYMNRADGIFGRGTEDAVKAFQRERGLPETGMVDARTRGLLQVPGG